MPLKYEGHPDQKFGPVTLAQHGDDLMILNLFNLMGIKVFTWLDLGAHHPLHISNTALAYHYGNYGINIEANPALFRELVTARPRDTTVNVGVALEDGVRDFYMYSETCGRNTFSLDEVETMKGKLEVRKTVKLNVCSIATILERYCSNTWPDLLLTDIEGLDFEVLKAAEFTAVNRPKVIVTEVRRNETMKFCSMLLEKEYGIYCRMGENLFFIDWNFWGKVF